MQYNWQQKDWPNFTYNLHAIEDKLFLFAEKAGRISGLLKGLSEEEQIQNFIDIMVIEAIKTSEIEGEYLSRQDVMSSIKNNLGLNKPLELVKDKRAKGIAELILYIRENYAAVLNEESLHTLHTMLMKGNKRINAGVWRSGTEPMRVISGSIGKEIIHYEAPPSAMLAIEMKRFINWFNDTIPSKTKDLKQAPVRAAVVHVYFESIHPYEDGNGRIGRALSEKALYQGLGMPIPISLSVAIESKKQAYYQALMVAQRSNEITPWVNYFVTTLLDAQEDAERQINFILQKTKFFDRFNQQFNERQNKVIRRMFNEGPDGFEGGMNAKKYRSIAKTSKATATRDLQQLVSLGAFIPYGGGRSTSYKLNL